MTSKEYNPFKDLVKLPDDTVMHIGLYTDGLGHVFKGRKTGTSDWIREDAYKYRYNFATSKIELADDENGIFYSSNLSLGNWQTPKLKILEFVIAASLMQRSCSMGLIIGLKPP